MKKFFAFFVTLLVCCTACIALGACGEVIHVDEIHIVAPASTEIRAGETFTLEYTTLPEEAAEKIKVNWKISDSRRLSYADGEFNALTCGTVKVTASVKGSEATDEIELKIIEPEFFSRYVGRGYVVVHPTNWIKSTQGTIDVWTASNGTTNMNVTTEQPLNNAYFSSPASSFQAAMKTTYELLGYTVDFVQPVTVTKKKYLGVERVRVDYVYSLTIENTTTTLYQTQLIVNNADKNLSCVLTVTFREENFDDKAQQLQETIFSQFLPA